MAVLARADSTDEAEFLKFFQVLTYGFSSFLHLISQLVISVRIILLQQIQQHLLRTIYRQIYRQVYRQVYSWVRPTYIPFTSKFLILVACTAFYRKPTKFGL